MNDQAEAMRIVSQQCVSNPAAWQAWLAIKAALPAVETHIGRETASNTAMREPERDQLELGMQFALWMRCRESWPTIHEVVAHWKMAPAFAYLMLAGYCEAADIESVL